MFYRYQIIHTHRDQDATSPQDESLLEISSCSLPVDFKVDEAPTNKLVMMLDDLISSTIELVPASSLDQPMLLSEVTFYSSPKATQFIEPAIDASRIV